MPFATVNNMKIHYEIRGVGPRLLFIHGIGADLNNPINIFNSPLAKYFTILAFDPRGLGESESAELPADIAEMSDDAAGLCEAVGWDKYHVFGASMGGMVAQELALRYPDKIDKLVLGVTHAGGQSAGPSVIDKLDAISAAEKLRMSDTRQDEAWAAEHPEIVIRAESQFKAAQEAMQSNPTLSRGYNNQMNAVLKHDTFDRLCRITAFTLVFGGRYDGSSSVRIVQEMADQIPHSRLELFESGHGNWFFDPSAWEKIIGFFRG